jgi:acyl carrier protein
MALTEQQPRASSGPAAIVVTEAQAIQLISELLEDRGADPGELDGASSLAGLGLDSVEIAELFMMLEETLGVRFDPASAEDMSTVADFTRLRPFGSPDA